VTITTGQPVGTSSADGGLVNTATSNHTHSCATNTNTYSNLPPYLEVIYGQRKDPSASTSLGDEEAVSSGGGGITYRYLYSGDGEMIAETIGLTTTIYIGNVYEKKDQGGTITEKKHYYAGSLRVAVSTKVGAGSWEVNFLLSDHLGSTSTTVDSSGGRVADIRYTPWGSTRYVWGTQMTNFTYTGQRSISYLNIIKMGIRWYDPALGRFTQPDSVIPGTGNPMAFDRYMFVFSNPLRFVDPSGRTPVSDTEYLNEIAELDLVSYGVVIEGEFTIEELEELVEALEDVGEAFLEAGMEGTAASVFKEVFDSLWFVKSTESLDGVTWARTVDNVITFFIEMDFKAGIVTRNTIVHEIGHAFDKGLNNKMTSKLQTFSYYGYGYEPQANEGFALPSKYWIMGQQTYYEDNFGYDPGNWEDVSEQFADTFLGWVYGEFGKGGLGIHRSEWAYRNINSALNVVVEQ
jgi:RHS repeat-associated protein